MTPFSRLPVLVALAWLIALAPPARAVPPGPAPTGGGARAWAAVDITPAVVAALQGVAQELAAAHHLDEANVAPLPDRVVAGLPPGAVSVQPRRVVGSVWRDRFNQWLDVRVDGRLCRTLAVPVQASGTRRVLQAAQPLAAGDWLDARNTTSVPVAAGAAAGAVAAADLQPQRLRLRHALAVGAIVRRDALDDTFAARRGTVVPVLFRQAAIELQTTGTLLDEAREGDAVRVRVPRLRSDVQARRMDGRYIVLQEDPGAQP